MAILHRDKLLELLQNKELIIESTDERVQFDLKSQIKSDTFDLRLHPKALIYKKGLTLVDTLAYDPEDFFEPVTIPLSGLILEPGHILFGSTLEIVCITNGQYIGRLSNRGTYSRFGVSVTCGNMRFPAGDPGTPDLQIANNSSIPVKIYPFSFIVQLQIETMDGTPEPYDGVYPKSIGPVPPILSQRDKNVSKLLTEFASAREPHFPNPESAVQLVQKIDPSLRRDQKPILRIAMSPRLRSLFGLLMGVLATVVSGYIINMISQGTWTYWKYVSVAFAGLLAGTLIIVAILVVIGSEKE